MFAVLSVFLWQLFLAVTDPWIIWVPLAWLSVWIVRDYRKSEVHK